MGVCTADSRLCRSRVAAKIFAFVSLQNFREIIHFEFRFCPEFHEISRNSNTSRQNFVCREIFLKFREIFLEFCEISRISNNFVKILCFAKFAQCCFAATLCWSRGGGGGGSGGGRRVPPCAVRTLPANADCAYIGIHF